VFHDYVLIMNLLPEKLLTRTLIIVVQINA
jgi:hypothetical protein